MQRNNIESEVIAKVEYPPCHLFRSMPVLSTVEVENLSADLGAFIPTKKDDAGYAIRAAAYVKFTSGAVGIHALGNFTINKKYRYQYAKNDTLATEAGEGTGMELGLGFD